MESTGRGERFIEETIRLMSESIERMGSAEEVERAEGGAGAEGGAKTEGGAGAIGGAKTEGGARAEGGAKTEGGASKRRSRWASSKDALSYILTVLADEELQVRTSDKVTTLILCLAIVSGTALMLFPQSSQPLTLLCGFLFLLSVIFYLANRLGILTTLDRRQAVFVAELMFGFTVLGVLLLLNVQSCLWIVRNLIVVASG